MTPILQRLIAVAICVLLGLFFLCEVALVVGGDAPHVLEVFVIVFGRVFLRVLLQNFNDLAATGHVFRSVQSPGS